MSDFQKVVKLFNEYMIELIKFKRQLIPKYIIINKNYLHKLLNSGHVTEFSGDLDGNMCIDYDTKSYFGTGIPLIFNDEIDTFAFVYEDGRRIFGYDGLDTYLKNEIE